MEYLIKNNEIYHKNEMLESKTLALYDVKITKLGNYTEYKKYNNHIIKKVFDPLEQIIALFGKDNVQFQKLENRLFNSKGSVSNSIRSDSYYRSYLILRNYALGNIDSWKSFITLTIKENISDPDIANQYLQVWVKNIRKIYPQFKYLGVPERQGRGAIHFHLLTNLEPGCEFIPKRKLKKLWQKDIKQYLNIEYYDIKYWNHGFSSVFDLNTTDENFSIIAYLSKYFWKDKDDHFFGRKKVLHSQNLVKPEVEYMSSYTDEAERYLRSLEHSVLVKQINIESNNLYNPGFELREYKHK